MNLRFVTHAKTRLHERGIAEEDVRQALERAIGHPVPGARPDTVVVQGYARGRVLKVVLNSADRELVVSAFWGSQS